jgi:copper chaperone CopZ
MAKILKKKLKIDGMHCTSCAMTIDFDLEDLDGVKSSKTNYAKQETEIEYDEEKISLPQILEQIKKTGYGVNNNPQA